MKCFYGLTSRDLHHQTLMWITVHHAMTLLQDMTLPAPPALWSPHPHNYSLRDDAALRCDLCFCFVCSTDVTPCASVGILLALHCKNQSVLHWTKWTCGLWNHSKDVMMSYHRSVSAFIAIKHTDRVRGVNMLTRGNRESCHSRVRMLFFPFFFLHALIHLKVYFFSGCGHFH